MSQVINMMHEFGTQYVWNAWSQEVDKLLTRALENGDTVDVSQCRFGNQMRNTLANFQERGLKIINSTEETLNQILEHNNRLYETLQLADGREVKMLWNELAENKEDTKSFYSMLKLISSNLGKGYVWKVPRSDIGLRNKNARLLLAILNLAYPDELFDSDYNNWRADVVNTWKENLTFSDYDEASDFVFFYPGTIPSSVYPIKYHTDTDVVRISGVGLISKVQMTNILIKCLPAWVIEGAPKDVPAKATLIKKLTSQLTNEGTVTRFLESQTIYGMIRKYGEINDGNL